MQESQLIQQLLEDFRETNGESFYYGIGRYSPLSTFLLNYDNIEDTYLTSPNFFDIDVPITTSDYIDDYEQNDDDYEYIRSVTQLLKSITEYLVNQVSINEWECSVCHFKSDKSSVVQHVHDKHPKVIADQFQSMVGFIDDDSKAFFGIFSKLQFDNVISRPENRIGYRGIIDCHIEAPEIDDLNSEYDGDCDSGISSLGSSLFLSNFIEEPPSAPSNNTSKNNFSLQKFIKDHKRLSNNSRSFEIEFDDALDIKEKLIKPLYDVYSPPIQMQNGYSIGERGKSPEFMKSNNPNRESQIEILLAEFDKEEQKPTVKKIKSVSYFETLPKENRNEIIHSVAKYLIESIAKDNLEKIVANSIQSQKKQFAKKIKEEKVQRAKDEEKRRKLEKQKYFEAMASQIAPRVIKMFVRDEITAVFEEERNRIASTMKKNISFSSPLIPDAPYYVVVSGIIYEKHHDTKYIIDLFSTLTFAKDTDRKPLIRYRIRQKRIEVLLFLDNENEVNRALSMSPMHVDFSTIFIETDSPQQNEEINPLFNGQQILELMMCKNLDNIHSNGGLFDFLKLSPMLDLSKYIKK